MKLAGAQGTPLLEIVSSAACSAFCRCFAAVQHLPLAGAASLQFVSPLVTTMLSALVLHESVRRHRWVAVVVGFVGVLIMIHPSPGRMTCAGALLGLMGALRTSGATRARPSRTPLATRASAHR